MHSFFKKDLIYLYLIIINNILEVKINVIEFAKIIGESLVKIPYKSHKKIPVVNTIYIPSDKSLVCFVFMVFIACGKYEIVVQTAAASPNNVIVSIHFVLL